MFKKNPNRPPIIVDLKKTPTGYKVQSHESHQLFVMKRVTRTMYRPDLIQSSNMGMESQGLTNALVSSTIIQPPSHVTIPAFAGWFNIDSIHQIEKQALPEFFQEDNQEKEFSFSCKNSKLYKYYRNFIIGMWRENVKKHLSSAQCRRNLVGDVSSIIRIHGFLENWGLINFPSKEHSKGIVVQRPQKLSCYVCEQANSPSFHIAQIEEVLFQICDSCFKAGLYSQEINPEEFVQVQQKNYRHSQNKIMNNTQLIRLLEVLGSAAGSSRDKDKQAWNSAQKQFPQFSREDLVFNFLRIPLVAQMNANVFDNNEDLLTEKCEPNREPSIFEDYQNPLQASIAVSYYKWKANPERYPNLTRIFEAAEKHAKILSKQQADKIEQVTKMLVEVTFSKLELKSLFIYEYEKLISKCKESQKKVIASNMAESLKQNVRLIEKNEEPEQLYAYRDSPVESDGMGMLQL